MRSLHLLIITSIFFNCEVTKRPNDYQDLTLKGSESMHEVFSTLAADFQKVQDTLKVNIEGGGSRTGLMAIKNNSADIGLSSFPFDLDSILGESHTISQRIVAYDGIVVINHLENPIIKLSNNQISNIFSGLIRDWSEIGGEPGPIMPIVRDANSGTQRFFAEYYRIFEVAPTAVIAGENHEIVDSVISNKNSIGYIGYAYYTSMVRNMELPAAIEDDSLRYVAPEPMFISNGSYPLKRSLRIYFDNEYDPRVVAFLSYLDSNRARDILESYGLIVG